MRRHYSTKDDKTGRELILSECSYNFACHWLDGFLRKLGYEVKGAIHCDGEDITVIMTQNSEGVQGRSYFYDEVRGYLLGE